MTSAVPHTPLLERRLRLALADTKLETPRPVADLGLSRLHQDNLDAMMRRGMRPAAVLAPVLRRGDAMSLLLTVRAPDMRSHGGQIAFPGGAKDAADITAVDTALREAQEEVGIDPQRVEVLGYLDDYPTISNFMVTPVVGLIDGELDLCPQAAEVAEVFEVPLNVALDPANFARKTIERGGAALPIMELMWQHYRIWGATAGMLWDLVERVARR